MHGGGDDAFGYSAPDLAPRDYQKALHWYQLAAKQGHGQAVGELGWAHAKGKGTPKDFIKAYAWATVAAVQGDTRAPSLKTGSERKCPLRSSPRPARSPPRFGPGLSASTSDKKEHFLVSGAGDEVGMNREASIRAGDQKMVWTEPQALPWLWALHGQPRIC